LALAALPLLFDMRDFPDVDNLKENQPAVLEKVATDLIKALGHDEPHDASAFGYTQNENKEQQFWYRQSAQPMHPRPADLWSFPIDWKVSPINPSPLEPGMISVRLGLGGELHALLAVPLTDRFDDNRGSEPSWEGLFTAAGLDSGDFVLVDDESASVYPQPPLRVDLTKRWRAREPREDPVEVVMAARGDRIVYFERFTGAGKLNEYGPSPLERQVLVGAVYTSMMIAFTGLLALRNLHQRRADTKGALRCALYYFVVDLAFWFVAAPRLGSIAAYSIFGANYLIFATAKAMRLWMFYVAVEPFIRRFWPHLFVSWSRVVAGRFRDPLVGRDLLLGCLTGSVWTLLFVSAVPESLPIQMLGDGRMTIATVLNMHQLGLHVCMSLMAFLLLAKLLLRNTWLAAASLTAILFVFSHTENPSTMDVILRVLFSMTLAAVYVRLGLVAAVSTMFSFLLLLVVPQTYDATAWYSASGKFVLAIVLAIAAFGFYTSTIAGLLSGAKPSKSLVG
jgi:serine/threonine-protein kinase